MSGASQQQTARQTARRTAQAAHMLKMDQDDHEIFAIRFKVFSDADREALQVREITDSTLYTNGVPNDNAPMSYYLGSTSASHVCKTCGNCGASGLCSGHYGIIRFPVPMYHPLWLSNWVVKFLRLACFFCSNPTVDVSSITATTSRRAIAQAIAARRLPECPVCNAKVQPSYTRCEHEIVTSWPNNAEFADENERVFATSKFTSKRAAQILEGMPVFFVEDVLHMENTPKDLCILNSLLVGPTCIRPSIVKRNSKGEEDLTKTTCEIIKLKNVLAEDVTSHKAWSKLQIQLNLYHDKDMKSSSGRLQRAVGPMKPKRSLVARLGGKGGRFRRTIFGKRLNNSARCVITPDPECDIWCLRVPLCIAMALTVATTVNARNRAEMEACVRIGMSGPGGAHVVVFSDGSKANLRSHLNESALQNILQRMKPGSVVHRMLRTGDVVLFGRQPTLHKFSIMALEVIVDLVFGISTFRFNTLLCKPYNADFDGDEMGMHVPQSQAARAEARMLLHVKRNIMDGADNTPIVGCVQDTLSGIHILTSEACTLTLEDFMSIVVHQRYARQSATDFLEDLLGAVDCGDDDVADSGGLVDDLDGGISGEEESVASALSDEEEEDETYERRRKVYIPGRAVIDLLFPPTFCYEHDGVSIRNGRIQPGSVPFCKSHAGAGGKSIMRVLCADYGEAVAAEWLSDVGRTIYQFISKVQGFSISISDMHVDEEHQQVYEEEMAECLADAAACDPEDESGQLDAISSAMDAGAALVRKSRFMQPESGLGVMIRAGAKGSALNARQIFASVGQQFIEGRPSTDGGRSTSRFPKFTHNSDPEARGFVRHSYKQGLTPTEYFWHASAGRVGLADTACGTAKTGYMQRRVQKGSEDTKSKADGTVRNSKNHVMYVRYLDGFSPTYLEQWTAVDLLSPIMPDGSPEMKELEAMRADLARIRMQQTVVPDRDLYVPFNVDRYMVRYEGRPAPDPVPFADVWRGLTALQGEFKETVLTQLLYHCGAVFSRPERAELLSPRRLAHLMCQIRIRIKRCLSIASDPIGSLEASSISAKTTQSTLDSFHSTGSELCTGIDRMQEIIEQSKGAACLVIAEPKTKAIARSKAAMQRIADSLKPVKLGNITLKIEEHNNDVDLPSYLLAQTPRGCRHLVVYLRRDELRAQQLTMLNILRHLKSQVAVRVSCSTLRSEQPFVAFHFETKGFNEAALRSARRSTAELLIHGFAEVRRAEIKTRQLINPEDGPIYDLHCICSSLAPFFLSDPSVFDLETLRCNHVILVNETYGIEATHQTMFCEIKNVLCQDDHVNNHHIHLLATLICQSGRALAVTRHGMARGATDCIQRASFEQPKAVFVQSATFCEESRNLRNCPSTSTLVGSIVGVGTGMAFVYPTADCSVAPLRDARSSSRRAQAAGGSKKRKKHEETVDLKTMQIWDCSVPPSVWMSEFLATAAAYLEEEAAKQKARQEQAAKEGGGGGSKEEEAAVASPTVAAAEIGDEDLQYLNDEFFVM